MLIRSTMFSLFIKWRFINYIGYTAVTGTMFMNYELDREILHKNISAEIEEKYLYTNS
jgi:hypothetical protein